MSVPDLVKEMDLVPGLKEGGSDRVYGCITPPLVVEATLAFE
jgi:hypothetical protein